MNNLLLIYKDNDTYFVKNNCNGSIVKLNQNYYEMLLNKKEEVIKKLFDNNFFISGCKNVKEMSFFCVVDNSCNLKCPYCFEQNKNNEYFDDQKIYVLIENLKNIIFLSGLECLNVTFTGGEPLLRFPSIKKVCNEINLLSKKYNVTINYDIITNGTLITNEMLNFFNINRFNIQISFDGYKELHNKFRFFDDKKGTFECIIEKLYEIKKYPLINVNIRINICSNEKTKYFELIEMLYKEFEKFRIYIDFVDVPIFSKYYLNDSEKLRMYNSFVELMVRNKRRDVFNYIEGGECMVRNKFAFTITPNMNFYRCYSFVGTEKLKYFSYQELCLDVSKTTFRCNNEKCMFSEYCSGGCIYKNYIVNNKLDIQCKYKFIEKMNKIIFLNELVKYGVKITEENDKNVQFFKLNI